MREVCVLRHLSVNTLKSYTHWLYRYGAFLKNSDLYGYPIRASVGQMALTLRRDRKSVPRMLTSDEPLVPPEFVCRFATVSVHRKAGSPSLGRLWGFPL